MSPLLLSDDGVVAQLFELLELFGLSARAQVISS
jgi:hypothetical protein